LRAVSTSEQLRELAAAEDQTPFRLFVSNFVASKVAVASLVVLVGIVLIAIFAPWISSQNPYDLAQLRILDSRLPPGSQGIEGTIYWIGSDDQGRDMLSAIFYGLRISLSVGLLSGFVAMIIGTVIGLFAAYSGGWVDAFIMRIVDIQLSFPAILIALILLAVLGRGVDKIVIALIAVQWTVYTRTVRSIVLVEREKDYILAAKSLELSRGRILFRHLLVNCLPPVIIVATVEVAHAIALEATLSFLGVGLPITEPSLGLLIANGYRYMLSGKHWISFYPGIALVITIMSINLVGDHLRDVLNPRSKR
jgi:peptide/nickel transport system permease protein